MKLRFKTALTAVSVAALFAVSGQVKAADTDSSVASSNQVSQNNGQTSNVVDNQNTATDNSSANSSSNSNSQNSDKNSDIATDTDVTKTNTSKKPATKKSVKKTTKKTTKKKVVKKSKKKTVKRHKTKYQPYADPTDMRKRTGNYWKKSSQTKTKYPNLRKVKNLNLRVSILGNRVYVRSGKKVLYTMYCSAGRIVNGKSLTPRGTYHTNSYHPYRFSSGLYPVGWIGQEYLFHSVPLHEWSNSFIASETHKVGKKPASHGCIRLTVQDAKWLHYHVPYRTKVIVKYR